MFLRVREYVSAYTFLHICVGAYFFKYIYICVSFYERIRNNAKTYVRTFLRIRINVISALNKITFVSSACFDDGVIALTINSLATSGDTGTSVAFPSHIPIILQMLSGFRSLTRKLYIIE